MTGTPSGNTEWGTLDPFERSKLQAASLGYAKTGYVIGRHDECDIVVLVPQLSKRHCIVFQEVSETEDGNNIATVFIEDLSSNGTFVNNKRLEKGKRRKLFHGDTIKLVQTDKQDENYIWTFRLPKQLETTSFDEEFTMEQHLGSGNFATVKLARHKATSKPFACKILDKAMFAGNTKMMQNVEQEVSILTALNHPCIIQIKQVFNLPSTINIVMELATGGELFDRIISKSKFSEHETRILMKQLFHALDYLHSRGIVHRDLKPENILLVGKEEDDLRIKISDFGLAKLVPEQRYLKTLCGTPNYVAPEVLGAKGGRAYGSAVDMWSCGVILYICLVGQPPFSDDLAPPSMMDQIKQCKYTFPSPWWDDVSAEAKDLIKKLIVLNPASRLSAAEALKHPFMQGVDVENPAVSQLPVSPERFVVNDTGFLNAAVVAQSLAQEVTTPKKARRLFTAGGDVTPKQKGREVDDLDVTPVSKRRRVGKKELETVNEEKEAESDGSPSKRK
ncbi:hypothetical protein HDU79_011410 [Rhizoclosmatium sp. JEL0117]|nr:hypothetical protein HDU79_011410 [Rhizoclosmatium sp. JEL0117]